MLELEDCRVDLETAEVLRDGVRATLTPNELALLRHLAAHEGRPIAKDRLHVDVFGYAPGVVSRAADYAVHRLRRQLERDPAAPRHLLTVPGVGFALHVVDHHPHAQAPACPAPTLPVEVDRFFGRAREHTALLELLGRVFEGPGIPPDIEALNDPEVLATGRDEVLELALELVLGTTSG